MYPNGSACDTSCHCVDGSASSAAEEHCWHENGDNKTTFIYFTHAENSQGPRAALFQSFYNASAVEQCSYDLNFAPIILPNQSLLAWTRSSIMTETNWVDEPPPTTTRAQRPTGYSEGEDPSVWRGTQRGSLLQRVIRWRTGRDERRSG